MIFKLSDNRLSEFPKQIESLVSMRYLDFSGNQIKEIPEFLGNCAKLDRLLAAKNEISSISKNINLQKLSLLKRIDVSRNKINEIPEEFFVG